MASGDGLSDCLQSLNLNTRSSDHTNSLSEITKNYESMFSWHVYDKTGKSRDVSNDILDKITEKLELMFDNKETFNFSRMCLLLANCYEIFLNGEFSKAINDVDNIIQTLKNAQMDDFFTPIADVCFHVVYSTKAFIFAFLDKDVQQILKNIKPSTSFSKIENAALNAIKSKVFLEYPPGGNKIALELIEVAQNFSSTDIHWTNIWLKAKGRVRRYNGKMRLPLREELEAADKLSSYENNLDFLLNASNVYREAGFILKINKSRTNFGESNKYYKLSADLALKVYEKAKNDLNCLYHCLRIFNDLPNIILQNKMYAIEDIVNKLSQSKNNRVHEIVGKFYLKIKKDYKNAKIYFEKSSSNGLFPSSLQLLKVECLLKPVDSFPVVQYLNTLYEKFTCPKRRLIIVSQILLYYIFCEKNPKELLHYLNVYLNEDIDYILKKHHFVETFPLFRLNTIYKPKSMLKVIGEKIEQLKMYRNWTSDNKTTLENVILKFSMTCNAEKVEGESEMDYSCAICLENDVAQVVFKPCNHQCACKTCWKALQTNENQPKCPMCRTVVISTIIY